MARIYRHVAVAGLTTLGFIVLMAIVLVVCHMRKHKQRSHVQSRRSSDDVIAVKVSGTASVTDADVPAAGEPPARSHELKQRRHKLEQQQRH